MDKYIKTCEYNQKGKPPVYVGVYGDGTGNIEYDPCTPSPDDGPGIEEIEAALDKKEKKESKKDKEDRWEF